jgi:hypothetical protein
MGAIIPDIGGESLFKGAEKHPFSSSFEVKMLTSGDYTFAHGHRT